MRRVAALLTAVPLLAALATPTAAQAAPTLPLCPTSGPQVCFTAESHTPQVTVPAGAADVTYADFTATVTNTGGSTVTHFTITDAPFTGASIRSISGVGPSGQAASCSTVTGACSYGNLASQKQVVIEVVLALSSTAAAGLNQLTLSLDEGTNDNASNTGGKTDYLTLPQSVTLLPRDGTSVTSFIPGDLGTVATLTTDKGGKPFAAATIGETEVGTTEIPAHLSAAVVASVQRSTAAGPCPAALCAMRDDWMQASVPGFVGGDSTVLRTTVRVDSTLVASLKSANPKTLAVYYRHEATSPLATLPWCTFSRSGVPAVLGCYTAVKEKDGDLSVVVYEDLNGFIRL